MTSNKITKIFLVITTIVVIVSAGLYYTAFSYFDKLNNDIVSIKGDIDGLEIQSQRQSSLRNIVSALSKQQDLISQYFIPVDGAIDYIKSIEGYAKSSGLTYSTDSVSVEAYPKSNVNNKEMIRISMTNQGSWTGVMRFLSLIENLPYNLKINSVDLNQTGVAPKVLWTLHIDFSAVKNK